MPSKYAVNMRTTISLDDRLAEQVRSRASEEGLSVSAFIARVLDDGLKRRRPHPTPPFRLVTVGEKGVLADIDLDRPRALVAEEDERIFGKAAGEP